MKIKKKANNTIPVITIDGPSGSGKGTISRLLANKLSWNILDSGALYRILAYVMLTKQIDVSDIPSLENIAHNLDVDFVNSKIPFLLLYATLFMISPFC